MVGSYSNQRLLLFVFETAWKTKRIFSGSKAYALPNLLKQEGDKGPKSEVVVADSLHASGWNREKTHKQGMKAYIPFRRERK